MESNAESDHHVFGQLLKQRQKAALCIMPGIRHELQGKAQDAMVQLHNDVTTFLLSGSRLLMMRDIPNSKLPLAQYRVPITRLTMHK